MKYYLFRNTQGLSYKLIVAACIKGQKVNYGNIIVLYWRVNYVRILLITPSRAMPKIIIRV